MNRIVFFISGLLAIQSSLANDFQSIAKSGLVSFNGIIIDSTCPIINFDIRCELNSSEDYWKTDDTAQEILNIIISNKQQNLNKIDFILQASEEILKQNPNLDLSKINKSSLLMTINYD